MKLFVVSDIHGHYKELIRDLTEAGFDETNENHLLISLGDMFDRGEESLEVYKYLKRLSDNNKAICIKGNHEPMFYELLENSNNAFNFVRNGTRETIDDFLHQTASFEMYCITNKVKPTYEEFANYITEARKEINNEFPELLPWLKNLPYYYETEKYIFTHASIDTNAQDWRYPKCEHYGKIDWEALMWDDGSFITKRILNTEGKKVVVGHFYTGNLRDMWQIDTKDKEDYSILKTEDKIFIDGCVPYTKKVNVLVIEDEPMKEINEIANSKGK